VLLLTTEQDEKKEYKEMLEGLCEEMPDMDLPGLKGTYIQVGLQDSAILQFL